MLVEDVSRVIIGSAVVAEEDNGVLIWCRGEDGDSYRGFEEAGCIVWGRSQPERWRIAKKNFPLDNRRVPTPAGWTGTIDGDGSFGCALGAGYPKNGVPLSATTYVEAVGAGLCQMAGTE